MAQIRKNKGGYNCFGQWLEATDSQGVRSVLAQQAQAYELKLLSGVIDYAFTEGEKSDPDFYITLFQHDGFSVDFKRNEELHTETMKEFVEQAAVHVGVVTSLEA